MLDSSRSRSPEDGEVTARQRARSRSPQTAAEPRKSPEESAPSVAATETKTEPASSPETVQTTDNNTAAGAGAGAGADTAKNDAKPEAPGRAYSEAERTLRVRQLTQNARHQHVLEIFGSFGKILHVDFGKDARVKSEWRFAGSCARDSFLCSAVRSVARACVHFLVVCRRSARSAGATSCSRTAKTLKKQVARFLCESLWPLTCAVSVVVVVGPFLRTANGWRTD